MSNTTIYRYYLDIDKLKGLIKKLDSSLEGKNRDKITDVKNNLKILLDVINDYIDPTLWCYIAEILTQDSDRGNLYDLSDSYVILDEIFDLYKHAFYNYLDCGGDFII